MAVTSARKIGDLKEKGLFERDNERIDKYTVFYTIPDAGSKAFWVVIKKQRWLRFDGKKRSFASLIRKLGDKLPAQMAELSLTKRAMSQPSYSLCRITPADKDHVLKFLTRFFFRDEPMNQAVNLFETPESRCPELEDYAVATLEEMVSVAAVDENSDFVGILINGIARREDAEYKDKSEECPNPKFKRILKVLSHLDREAKIWEKLPKECHTVMEVRIASTHSGWRGRGLMRVLCEESERLAKAIGACAMRIDTTSAFSAAASERLGYKKIYSIPYADLPFAPQPKPPHLDARVYIKELL